MTRPRTPRSHRPRTDPPQPVTTTRHRVRPGRTTRSARTSRTRRSGTTTRSTATGPTKRTEHHERAGPDGPGPDAAPVAGLGTSVRTRARRLRRRDRAAPDPPVAPHGQPREVHVDGGGLGGQHLRRRAVPRRLLAAGPGRLDRRDLRLARRPAGPELELPLRARARGLGDLQPGRGPRGPRDPRRAPRPRRPGRPSLVGPRAPRPRRPAGGRGLVAPPSWPRLDAGRRMTEQALVRTTSGVATEGSVGVSPGLDTLAGARYSTTESWLVGRLRVGGRPDHR